MKFQNFVVNENMVDQAKSLLKRMDFRKAKTILKNEYDSFVGSIRVAGIEREVISVINKHFDTRYRSFDDINRLKIQEGTEFLTEDLAHWWDLFKSEAFPTLAFYPALTVWLEIDKLVNGQDMNIKKTTIYALFWILLVSGKYIKGWLKWKQQNPEEYKKERASGKGGLV